MYKRSKTREGSSSILGAPNVKKMSGSYYRNFPSYTMLNSKQTSYKQIISKEHV